MTPEQQTNHMNNPINDGGPAFPITENGLQGYNGMLLRDYFAARAMIGMLSSPNAPNDATLAEYAYKLADAMLAAREVKP